MGMEVTGHTGQVSFDGQFVTIHRKGFLARASVGKGEKRIPVSSITAVQFKPAGPMVNGFISFTMGGGNERRSSFGSQTTDAARDENSVVFTKKQMPAFEQLRAAVEQSIGRGQQLMVSAPSLADELQKLAGLHAQGILTDAEFVAKKAELLARM